MAPFFYVIASKYDFPSVPMKLLNTTNMTRKQKDKIRKKQEKLDRTLETIGIEEKTFLAVFRDNPMEVRHIFLIAMSFQSHLTKTKILTNKSIPSIFK